MFPPHIKLSCTIHLPRYIWPKRHYQH